MYSKGKDRQRDFKEYFSKTAKAIDAYSPSCGKLKGK